MESTNIIWEDRKRTFLGLPWSFTKYSFSEERLFISKGLFTTEDDEIRLYRVLDISLTRTLGQKLFGLGTVKINSSDKRLGNFEIKNIKKPKEVKEQLSQLVEQQRESKRVSSREYMTADDYIEETDDTE